MKVGIPGLALASAGALFGISVAAAQTAPAGPPPMSFASPPHKNLKVLPADIPGPQLIATMKFFAQSLGVRCTFCHVGAEGQPLSAFDFSSDAKREKETARHMMAMVQQINQQNFGVTDLSKAKVTCFTCHRGSPHPQTQPSAAAGAPPTPTAPTVAPSKPERGA
jgi:Photosynthetic reaction centre cytochrome C subunit